MRLAAQQKAERYPDKDGLHCLAAALDQHGYISDDFLDILQTLAEQRELVLRWLQILQSLHQLPRQPDVVGWGLHRMAEELRLVLSCLQRLAEERLMLSWSRCWLQRPEASHLLVG